MENEPQNGTVAAAAEEVQIFPLDDVSIEALGELREQMKPMLIASNTIVSLFLRRHKLPGNWRVADNGRELVRVPDNAPSAG